jgi:hypothetical protein
MTVRLTAELAEPVFDPDNFLGEYPRRPPVPKAAELSFECTGEGFAWLVGLADAVAPEDPEAVATPEEARYRPGSPRPRSERLVPDVRPTAGSSAFIVLPSPFVMEGMPRARSVVLYFELGKPPGDEATPEVLTELGARVATALNRVGKRARTLERDLAAAAPADFVADTVRGTLARLGDLMASGADPRQAMVFLAGALDAPLARDLVLVLDRSALDRLVSDLIEAAKIDTAAAPFDPRWSLESAAWRELVRALSAGDERPPELRAAFGAIALGAAGQLGAFPALIEDALVSSPDTEAFQERLVSENWIFLEDSSPAARARAFAWLTRRGLGPKGFDPLAPRAARRAALEAEREVTP